MYMSNKSAAFFYHFPNCAYFDAFFSNSAFSPADRESSPADESVASSLLAIAVSVTALRSAVGRPASKLTRLIDLIAFTADLNTFL